MTEALAIAPDTLIGVPPKLPGPNFASIPDELINPDPRISEQRGRFIESRVGRIITGQTDLVAKVILNEPNSSEDIRGHDLTVILKDGSPLRTVYVQVKSRKESVTAYKQKIRNKYFPDTENSPELVKRWLTEHGVILINGTQIKTDKVILEDSFIPQLERIQRDAIRRQGTESSGQMVLFPEPQQIQIFPEVA